MVPQKLESNGEPNLAASNRRSEPRFPLTFPIEVAGFGRSGKYFVERTSCCDVAQGSCAFALRANIPAGSVLAIRSFHWQNSSVLESMPLLFQVVRIEPHGGSDGHLVAAVRLHPRASRL